MKTVGATPATNLIEGMVSNANASPEAYSDAVIRFINPVRVELMH